ncbi:hypothetical protein G7Y89_g6124 [Cudoniella acicularis]|uniref:Protein artemis n=1 Tax=Cudoniella acicularis TaxID=354080 RepID=A0A8H4W360_9HELO|nr:hypothetical protein G7Y89_g6124 [Cudoniella acicularis]
MSTFGGLMVEFPDIRVDFFRPIKDMQPPLACFLSHIHSDHLTGLETLKSPFVYCSAATRELLLRLERQVPRLNFALGILEARKQHYKHLTKLLKPIPLETPTLIELRPGQEIQVTLFNANHCTGAVMFLFESDDKAVLYTGDIRSEPWFVNNLTRNPFLIEYTTGLKNLDCIYLDTSNLEPITFPPKADGLKELLQKVSKYPDDTVFHFSAWTFGYEEVWMTLSRALKSPIHVDEYKIRLYQSLRGDANSNPSGPFLAHEGPVLTGYQCGNTPQVGCLTTNENARIHSCEKGMNCPAINENIVWIKPIITRTKNGGEIAEAGVGGGLWDLAQEPEDNPAILGQLIQLFVELDDSVVADIKSKLPQALRSSGRAALLEDMGFNLDDERMSREDLAKVMLISMSGKRLADAEDPGEQKSQTRDDALPRVITFPYSRHSSYAELCDLVRVFQPKDVYPCTVDEATWHEGKFGSATLLFSVLKFLNREMREAMLRRPISSTLSQQTQTTARTQSSQDRLTSSPVQRFSAIHKPRVKSLSIRRNSNGQLRAFDGEGREVPPPVEIRRASTPPRIISASSPSSASQGLRRKAIVDELMQGRAKRRCLQLDGSNSSPPPEEGLKEEQFPEVIEFGRTKGLGRAALFLPPGQKTADIGKPEPIRIGSSTESTRTSNPKDADKKPEVVRGGSSTESTRTLAHKNDIAQPEMIIDLTSSPEPSEHPDNTEDPGHANLGATAGEDLDIEAEPFNDSHTDTPGPEIDTDVEGEDNEMAGLVSRPGFSAFRNSSVPRVLSSWDETYDWDYHHEDIFYDNDEEVFRCRYCGHEIWSPWLGFCTGCEEGDSDGPYQEVLDPEAGYRPKFELISGVEEGFDLKNITGPYLDCNSSAYDTQDDKSDLQEEYEIDSFIDDSIIDDASQCSDEEDDASLSDGETDYKEKFKELEASHNALIGSHSRLVWEYDELKRDVLGSDYESRSGEDVSGDDVDDQYYENGVLLVDVAVPDPVITELVLSANEQSQASVLSPGRIQNRVEAFEAAKNNEWHTVSLESINGSNTGDEERQASIEL